jgi:hypothetical protein
MGSQQSRQSKSVEAFVDKLLQNKKINSSFVYDPIERHVYINLITLILENIEGVLEEFEFKIFDKKIKIVIETISQEDEEKKE